MSLENAFSTLLQGLGLVGNAITYFVQAIFSFFGLNIPSWVIGVASIIILLLTLIGIGKKLGKIVMVILVCIITSLGAGLLSGLLQII